MELILALRTNLEDLILATFFVIDEVSIKYQIAGIGASLRTHERTNERMDGQT